MIYGGHKLSIRDLGEPGSGAGAGRSARRRRLQVPTGCSGQSGQDCRTLEGRARRAGGVLGADLPQLPGWQSCEATVVSPPTTMSQSWPPVTLPAAQSEGGRQGWGGRRQRLAQVGRWPLSLSAAIALTTVRPGEVTSALRASGSSCTKRQAQ